MSNSLPQLADGFSRARTTAVISAAVLALLHLRLIPANRPLPVIGIELPDAQITEAAFALITAYSIVRLLIEWCHSGERRRTTTPARIDLALALLVPGAVLAWYGARQFDYTMLQALPVVPTAVLLLTGLVAGQFAALWIGAIPLIRSRQEALRLGLHRVPFALRAQARMTAWWLFALAFVVCLSPAFSAPLNSLWPWFLGLPAMLGPLSLIPEFWKPLFSYGETKTSLRQHFLELRKAFDWHDAVYQINGWDSPAKHEPSSLMNACTEGDEEAVRRLLRAGVPVERVEHLGWTPLMIAVAQQHEGVSRFLLESGANPNVANVMGRSPLSFAARYANERLVTMLLEFGANPNPVDDKFKEPPLHAAAHVGHRAIVELLLQAGADQNLLDLHKRTALEYAESAGHGDVAALLRRAAR